MKKLYNRPICQSMNLTMIYPSLLGSVAAVIMSVIFWLLWKRKQKNPKTELTAMRHTVSNGFETIIVLSDSKVALEEVLRLQIRSDDVIVATYPKAGTTWMQEIVWLICNNVDTLAAKETILTERWTFLEYPAKDDPLKKFRSLRNCSTDIRRFIKTHLPFQLLPNELQRGLKCKMIYLARNPKDTCVSYYHFHRMNQELPESGTWSEFLTKFCSGQILYGPWFEHVLKYWQMHQERRDSIYFVTFEALKKDLRGEVVRLADFLEKDLTDEQIDIIVHHCSFNSMSRNNSVNHYDAFKEKIIDFNVSKFMRKGEVGDWKNHFTINENKAFDKLYQEKTKDWTLQFEFELVTSSFIGD